MPISQRRRVESEEIPRSFTVDVSEDFAEELAEAARANGFGLKDVISVALQLFLKVDEARRTGGTVEVTTPQRDDLTFTLQPYEGKVDG
jgi:hypothetical protein